MFAFIRLFSPVKQRNPPTHTPPPPPLHSAAPVVTCSSFALRVFDAPPRCFCPCLPNMTGIWACPSWGHTESLSSSCREEGQRKGRAGANPLKTQIPFPSLRASCHCVYFFLCHHQEPRSSRSRALDSWL